MRILIITENVEIYKKVNEICDTDKIHFDMICKINEIYKYNLFIIDLTKDRIEKGDIKSVYELRCKSQTIPILAVLNGAENRDKIKLLQMKANEFVEYPLDVGLFKEKINQLLSINI